MRTIFLYRRLRRAAYKSTVFFLQGFMGEGKRIVIHACVKFKTREWYPNPNGIPYTGHMWF